MSLLTNVLKLWRTGQYLLPADSGFMVKHLFANGEPGFAKLDFSGFAGMYQDRARTIPYTAVEQPLGSFTGLNGVTATAPADVNRGVVSARVNLLTKTEDFSDAAAWSKAAGGTGTLPVVTPNAALAPDGTMTACQIVFDQGAGTTVSDRSLISQAIAPMAVNYDGGLWLRTVSGTATLVFRHAAASAYLSIPVTTTWTYFSRRELGFAGAGSFQLGKYYTQATGSSTVLAWGASLTLAIDAHLPYQRVNTPTDYDTAGFSHYLAFNGINTAYVTPSIDFTGTDKMTVWAGVTKLSDAATAVVAEFGNFATPLNGSFLLAAPASAAPNIGFTSRGTLNAAANVAGYPAPLSAVTTGASAISTDTSVFRLNGVQVSTSSSDQGTGNYGNYPLYIGARAGTSLFFNGRLYSLIARGAATPLPQIEAVETLIRKTMRLP